MPVQGVGMHVSRQSVGEHAAGNLAAIERTVLRCFGACLVDKLTSISRQPRQRQARVQIQRVNALVGGGHQHLALQGLLATKHHAIDAADAHRSAALLYGLAGVLQGEK